jgi:hypothetical protein
MASFYSKEEIKAFPVLDSTKNVPSLTRMVVCREQPKGSPFQLGDVVLYIGEVQNMSGHVAFAHKGQILWGYHDDNFAVIPADE